MTEAGKSPEDLFGEWSKVFAELSEEIWDSGEVTPQHLRDAWSEAWEDMHREAPEIRVCQIDFTCGCCSKWGIHLFASEDAAAWAEILYPTYKPLKSVYFE